MDRKFHIVVLTSLLLLMVMAIAMVAFAQGPPAAAAPRRADGRILIGSLPGQAGMWLPVNGGAERFVNPDNVTADDLKKYPDRLKVSEVPFQDWSRAVYTYRRANQFEPHTRCKPSGGPRQFLTPYGVEFVEMPELQRILIMDQGGPHTFRTIYMDGRPHPKSLTPAYYGHSIGHWESDTLVVDTIGFNEGFWLDRTGLPSTEQLHLIERFTRLDSKSMKYEARIEDMGAYTKVWSGGFSLSWDSGQELFEYVCQDNNYASNLMLGSQESMERPSLIAP